MLMLKCLFLVLSFGGSVLFFNRKLKVNLYTAPAAVISVIVFLIYIAGLLNCLQMGIRLISLSGILMLLFSIPGVTDLKFKEVTGKHCIAVIAIVLMLVYVMWYLKGAVYADGDTMTHWGVIIREMVNFGELPSFKTTAVTYASYPPATATWLYYVVHFIGYDEARTLLAQTVWLMACGMGVFALNRTRSRRIDLLCALGMLILVFYSVGIDDLKVDNLLPLEMLAGFFFVYSIKELDRWKFLILLTFMADLALIKNSGILFSVFLLVALLYKERNIGINRKTVGLNALISGIWIYATYYIWQKHVAYVFVNGGASRHSMTAEYMESLAQERTGEVYRQIFDVVKGVWFSNNASLEWPMLFAFAAAFVLAMYVVRDETSNKEIRVAAIETILGYVIYKAGLIGMYFFNMPLQAALEAAAYDRYQRTYTIIMFASVLFFLIQIGIELEKRYSTGIIVHVYTLAAIALLSLFICVSGVGSKLQRPDYQKDGNYRIMLDTSKRVSIRPTDKVLVYSFKSSTPFMARFLFYNGSSTTTADVRDVVEAMESNVNGYDYIFVLHHDAKAVELMQEYGYPEDTTFAIPLHNRSNY